MRNSKKKRLTMYTAMSLIIVIVFSLISITKVNSLQAMTTPIVTLSNYSPNATNVQYTIKFTTDDEHELQPSDWIEVRGFHVFNMPSNNFGYASNVTVNDYNVGNTSIIMNDTLTSDPSDYTVRITLPQNFTPSNSIEIVFHSSIGLKNPPLQSTWDENNHYENNPGKNQWMIYIRTSREQTDTWSSPYTISPPAVSNVSVSVSPNVVGKNAVYDISFKTGINGELHGGTSTITVQFPEGTVLPNTIPASSVTVQVGNYQGHPSSSITPSGEIVTITMPTNLYAGNNAEVHVIFSTSANIQNPNTPGDTYFVEVKTSSEDNFVESAYYSIMPSAVENLSVSVNPNTVSTVAEYNIKFRTSSTGALAKGSSYIFVQFPDATVIPPIISKSAVLVNQVEASSCDVLSDNVLKIGVPDNIGASTDVSISITTAANITNPPTPGNNYTISLYTTGDPGTAISNTYSISESHITPATVTVMPNVVGVTASYVISFSVGSDGSLSTGDKIFIVFPQGTILPNTIPTTAITVNGAACIQSPTVSGNKLTIYAPQFISADSKVIIVITASAGIKNPTAPKTNYTLLISTVAEPASISSSPFEIKDTVHTSLDITPKLPNGNNGFYITQPKVRIVVSNPANLSYTAYYKIDNGSFAVYTSGFEITIPEGIHTLYYYAQDSFGNKENIKQARFKVDLTKPSLIISSPKNGDTFNTQSVTIEGKTSTDSILTIDGKKVDISSDGSFSYVYTFSKEGTFSIKVRSEDTAGNFTEQTLTLKYVKQIRIMLQVGNKHCYLNDKDYYLDASAYIKNNRVMVPVRFISEALGFNVQWDPIFKIVSIYANGKLMRLQIGNTTADLFGKAVMLDSVPEIKNGRTFVPLRFISENFGANITWDPQLRIVKIIYPGLSG
jgi:hypothetical protein